MPDRPDEAQDEFSDKSGVLHDLTAWLVESASVCLQIPDVILDGRHPPVNNKGNVVTNTSQPQRQFRHLSVATTKTVL